MSHVFISYQNADSDFAALLMLQLERAGLDTWLDKERLRPGFDWSEAIDEAISSSFALVVVMSPDAKASEYVTYEWAHAIGAGVRVVPVLIRETSLHPRLARIQYLKFTDPAVRPWESLVRELKDAADGGGAIRLPGSTPAFIKRAVEGLDSPIYTDRKSAIYMLANSGEASAIGALVHALKHPLKDVRIGSAVALAKAGDLRALSGMAEALTSMDDDESWPVGYGIKCLGDAGIDYLLECLRSGDSRLQAAAVTLAGELRTLQAIPLLIDLIDREDSVVAKSAMKALRNIRAESSVPVVLATIRNSGDEELLEIAFDTLNILAPEEGQATISTFLLDALRKAESQDDLPTSAWIAFRAFRSVGDCSSVNKLAEYLGSSNPSSQILVAELIRHFKCQEHAAALAKLLHDERTGTWKTNFGVEHHRRVAASAAEALNALEQREGP